ncbi:MAG: nitrilase-related carbon-nitrogen hydrolase [Candidatus Thorarchaeota archaeon]
MSLVQAACMEGEREKNFSNIQDMLRNHKSRTNREFIILPELFAIGFRYSDYNIAGAGHPGATTEFLQDLAEEYSSYIVASDIEKAGSKWFNTLIMTSPKGKVIATYRKIHPFQDEKTVFSGGDSLIIVDAGGIKVGLEICYDLRFPELSRALALNGAELVLMAAAFPDPRAMHWDTLVMARAIENQLYFAAANRIGFGFDGRTYFGHSQIVDPWGMRLTRINSDMAVFSNNGDTDMIHEVRKQITCFQDRVPEYYGNVILSRE